MNRFFKTLPVFGLLALAACATKGDLPADYTCDDVVAIDPVTLSHFKFDSYKLTPQMHQELAPVIQMLMQRPEYQVLAKGYTDDVGTDAYNMKLGEKRALSVVREMIAEGVDPQRLTLESFGESDPVASNEQESGRAKNRRVVLDFMK